MNSRIIFSTLLTLTLGACGAGQTTFDEDTHAPELDPIGDHTVVVNRKLEFKITASDDRNHSIIYTSNGIAGENNPFEQVNPAVFDAINATFSWQTGNQDEGSYMLEFNALDGQDSSIKDSEIIVIEVISKLKNGETLVNNICVHCHGLDLKGSALFGSPNIRGKSLAEISYALNTVTLMMQYVNLSNHDRADVAEYLGTLTP